MRPTGLTSTAARGARNSTPQTTASAELRRSGLLGLGRELHSASQGSGRSGRPQHLLHQQCRQCARNQTLVPRGHDRPDERYVPETVRSGGHHCRQPLHCRYRRSPAEAPQRVRKRTTEYCGRTTLASILRSSVVAIFDRSPDGWVGLGPGPAAPTSSLLVNWCRAGSARRLIQELGPSTHRTDSLLE